jgi:hypothetical protein
MLRPVMGRFTSARSSAMLTRNWLQQFASAGTLDRHHNITLARFSTDRKSAHRHTTEVALFPMLNCRCNSVPFMRPIAGRVDVAVFLALQRKSANLLELPGKH